MNKNGSILDGIMWIIIGMITLLVFGGLIYIHNSVYDGLHGVGMVGEVNITNITETVMKPTHDSLIGGMDGIGFLILAGGAFSILISNFLVRKHPAWLIAYILITIIAVILSAYVSNEYMALLNNEALGVTLSQLTMSNFVMQWLPYWSAIIGIFGAIFLFIGSMRDNEFSEGIR